MEAPTAIFRFLDLPAELRNRVYQELLCSFTFYEKPRSRPDSTISRILNHRQQSSVNEVTETASTSILLVSRNVHREAYDVMVKTNIFIRIKGRDFNWSDILPRAQIPVISMDRQRVAQFKGHLASLSVSEDVLDAGDEDKYSILFDFMILGRHWDLLCQSISYLYRHPGGLRVRMTFNSIETAEQSSYKTPFDSPFMAKTEKELLQAPQAHWRGIESFTIDGLIDAHPGDLAKTEVAKSPWADQSAWLSRIEEKVAPLENFRVRGEAIEAFSKFEEITSEAHYVAAHSLATLPNLLDRMKRIYHICSTGTVRCFLHVLESYPQDKSDYGYQTMLTHASHTNRPALIDPQPKVRAQSILFKAQLRRINEMETGKQTDLLTGQQIAQMLLRAEELDPENEEIREEQERFLEVGGLKPLSIRDIATAL